MANTQQAYERYEQLNKAYLIMETDPTWKTMSELRKAINATIEALEAKVPVGEVYTREDMMAMFEFAHSVRNIIESGLISKSEAFEDLIHQIKQRK
jgi:hypothetical protein